VERAKCDTSVQPQHTVIIPTEFDVVGDTMASRLGKPSSQRGVDVGLIDGTMSQKAEVFYPVILVKKF
jgi:hypothetical protein